MVDGATQVACLSLAGRLLTFGLDELKLQPNGGRGLTLIDLDAKDALVSVAAFAQALQVMGKALRGDKPREDVLKGRRSRPTPASARARARRWTA